MPANRSNSLSYESLEPKLLLAGNVRVAFSDATVYMRGDSASNQVEVVQDIFGGTQDITVRDSITPTDGLTVSDLLGPAHPELIDLDLALEERRALLDEAGKVIGVLVRV